MSVHEPHTVPGSAASASQGDEPGTAVSGASEADAHTELDTQAQWRLQKTLNAQHQAAELERRQRRESDQAAAMLAEFVGQAQEAGIEPVRLFAKSYNGSTRYKTNLYGWYLKMNQSVAVDTSGNFYVLSVQGGLLQRFAGTSVTPSAPPLVLGLGGRDGESLDMSEAIDRVLHPEKYR